MVEKLVSRAFSRAGTDRASASAAGENGCRDDRTKSAPSNVLACASTAARKVADNEPTAAKAATPNEMDNENQINRTREARDSRHAIRQVHRCNSSRITPTT
jgi:hypothetical protein